MALDKLLFQASPDGFGPNTFTRSSSGFFVDRDGVLQLGSTDVLRVEHLDLDGDFIRETPSFLLELASTNLYTRSDEFDNAAWTKTNTTVEADDGPAADLSTTADLIVPSTLANIHLVEQTLGVTDSVDHALTVYASPGGLDFITLRMLANGAASLAEAHFALTSSGAVVDSGTAGAGALTTARIDRIRSDVYRCTLIGQISTSTSMDARIYVAEASSQMGASWAGGGSSGGLGVRLWGAQLEDDQAFPTSLMLSSVTALSRADDTLFFPFTATPREMTVYVKFIESGTKDIVSGGIFHIGGASAMGDPRFHVHSDGTGLYVVRHDNGVDARDVTAATGPALNDLMELRAVLNADGSVFLGQSIASADETVTAATASAALAAAWNDTRIYIGSRGSADQGSNSILEIKIAAGVKTMAEMRSLQPFFSVGGITVPVVQNGAAEDRLVVGDGDRAFDGTWRETIRSRVSVWDADTVPMSLQDSNDVQAVLESSTQPQTAFGDMIAGSTGEFPDVFTRVTGKTPVQSSTERRYVLSFTARESS